MRREHDRTQAAFLDTVYRAADRDDVNYFLERARSADGPVLELGCGTGRIYLELLEAGVDADGLDLSPVSLTVLRKTAAERGLEPSVWQGDMTSFGVDREYALVTCPFNAIQELTTVDQQLCLFEAAHEALAPSGTFVFDTFVPDIEFIADAWGEWQERTVEFRGDPVAYHTRNRLVDEVSQTYVCEKKAITQDGEQLFEFEGEATLLPSREIELLLRLSPFESWEATGDYTDEPLVDGHTAQVWSARKAGPQE